MGLLKRGRRTFEILPPKRQDAQGDLAQRRIGGRRQLLQIPRAAAISAGVTADSARMTGASAFCGWRARTNSASSRAAGNLPAAWKTWPNRTRMARSLVFN